MSSLRIASAATSFVAALTLTIGWSAHAQATEESVQSHDAEFSYGFGQQLGQGSELQSDLQEPQTYEVNSSSYESNWDRNRPPRPGPGPGPRPPGPRPGPGPGPGPGPYPGPERYEWVFDYVDRGGGCQRCNYSCYNAPRCDRFTEGATMACPKPGTHNDQNVFRCQRVGRW